MGDMACDNCGSTDAVVHLTQIVNNEMSTHHLCEKCAAEKGLESAPDVTNLSRPEGRRVLLLRPDLQ